MTETTSGNSYADQPIRRVVRDGTEFVILGTAHVSKTSADAVRDLLAAESFDAVAVELCPARAAAMQDPDAVNRMDLLRVLREGRATAVAAGLALGAYQRRLAKQFGVEPGADMKAGIDGAAARNLPYWTIDRDVGLTLRRTRAAVSWWERTKITAGILASVLDDSEIEEADIERLKQRDMLEGTFTEFAKQSPPLFEALIAERDRYMAARLRQEARHSQPQRVLVVIGAGHLEGMARHLADEQRTPEELLPPLSAEPPPSNFGKWFGWFLIALVIGGFGWAFSQGQSVGLNVVLIWVLTTGVLGAIGAALAGAHPLSVLGAFVASPVTPLHPALVSGMISGGIELWVRKPTVGDFAALRDDLAEIKGWWRNRVSRVFLVFVLTNVGTSIGVYIAGFKIAAILAKQAVH